MHSRYDWRHILLLNLSTIFVATAAIFGKIITLHPAQLIFFRSLLAGIFLAIFLKWQGVHFWQQFQRYQKFFLLTGILLGVHWVMLFWAVQIATVSLAILSVFTFPIMTALLEPLFFKSRLDAWNLLAGAVVVIGVAILVPEFSLENQTSVGVLLGILSALLIAVRNLLCKKYIKEIPSSEMMFFQIVISAVLLVPSLLLGKPDFNTVNISLLISMALVSTALGHTLFVYCLKFFPTSTASVIVSIQPVYAIVLSMILLKESPDWHVFLGGFLILGTVLWENIRAGFQNP